MTRVAKKRGIIDRSNRIDRMSFPLSGRERENNQNILCLL